MYKQMMVVFPVVNAREKRLGVGQGVNVKGVDGDISAVVPFDPR